MQLSALAGLTPQRSKGLRGLVYRSLRLEARIDVFRGVAKDSEVEAEQCPTMIARRVSGPHLTEA